MNSLNPPDASPLLVNMQEAARLLGLSRRTVWSLARGGQLPCVRIRRRVLFSPDSLRAWLRTHEKGGAK